MITVFPSHLARRPDSPFYFTRWDGGGSILRSLMQREVGMDQENLVPLIEFIGKKFDQVDQRFEVIDRRFEEVATKGEVHAQQAETRRHFDVVAEGLRGQMLLLAEGVATLDEKLNRFREEVAGEFKEVKGMVRISYTELDRRIQGLESNCAALNERVGRLEARTA